MPHNGWTNYETWLVALWIDNDQGVQGYWREAASEAAKSDTPRADLGDRLKEEITDGGYDLVTTGLYADLLRGALGNVDWAEIARHLLADAAEDSDAR